ncbi:hypothetical protein CO157_05210 [Candidatus Peregrinibacteria bacterium CG_4_9_14_3_um_filter_49_12]|nr:MAG: hypothetical protein CO157_05210 [Candidatus Peregrinibacteria bacterium CG_4_9_14_3_um_filter_49_12]
MDFHKPLPHAVKHAQELRKRATPAEKALWNLVRNRKFHGLKFRRQAPVGRCIVDFLCSKPWLIIELDGPIHDFSIPEDTDRTIAIREDYNIPVLRLRNEEVLHDIQKALQKIERALFSSEAP